MGLSTRFKPSSPLPAKATLWLKGGEWASFKKSTTSYPMLVNPSWCRVLQNGMREDVPYYFLGGAFLMPQGFGAGLDLSIASIASSYIQLLGQENVVQFP